MRADSLAGQFVAVLSRRTPAFQPVPSEPLTFPGRIHQASAALARPKHSAQVIDADMQRPAGTPGADITTIPAEEWPWPAQQLSEGFSYTTRTHAYRRSSSLWVVAGIAAAAVGIVAIVTVLLTGNIHATPTAPISQSSTLATPSVAASRDIGEQQAATNLSRLLMQSFSYHATVNQGAAYCEVDPANFSRTLNGVANAYQSLISELASLPGSSTLPPALLTDLAEAWQADVTADQAYTRHVNEFPQACVLNDTGDPNYQVALAANAQATSYSEKSTSLWNPIATKYGLTTYQGGQI